MARPSMVLRMPGPQQTPSGPSNPCEIYMNLYENSTVDAIMPRTLFTSSQLVSLNLNRSFYSVIFPIPPVPFPEGSVTHDLFHLTDKTEYSRLYVPNSPGWFLFFTCCSVTSNIFAIAFVLMTCTRILPWSTSSYDLNPVLRRKLSI